jgi:hypothetical protein
MERSKIYGSDRGQSHHRDENEPGVGADTPRLAPPMTTIDCIVDWAFAVPAANLQQSLV